MDTSDLDILFIGNLLELSFVLFRSEKWEFDVHRSSHGGTKVGWARGDVTEMVVVGEFNIGGLEMCNGSAESIENLNDTSILLH